MKRVAGKCIEKSFGAWKTKGSGVEYTRKIRAESESRERRLGI